MAAPAPAAAISDGDLPIYSVVIALYREAAAVKDLVAALRSLNYPPEKLDIKLVLDRAARPDGIELWRL